MLNSIDLGIEDVNSFHSTTSLSLFIIHISTDSVSGSLLLSESYCFRQGLLALPNSAFRLCNLDQQLIF